MVDVNGSLNELDLQRGREVYIKLVVQEIVVVSIYGLLEDVLFQFILNEY